jgi:hypothetical protein
MHRDKKQYERMLQMQKDMGPAVLVGLPKELPQRLPSTRESTPRPRTRLQHKKAAQKKAEKEAQKETQSEAADEDDSLSSDSTNDVGEVQMVGLWSGESRDEEMEETDGDLGVHPAIDEVTAVDRAGKSITIPVIKCRLFPPNKGGIHEVLSPAKPFLFRDYKTHVMSVCQVCRVKTPDAVFDSDKHGGFWFPQGASRKGKIRVVHDSAPARAPD